MDKQRDAARVNLVANVPRGLSAAEYDYGWLNEWDDMKKYGPFSRHLRRLILDMIRPLEFESVLDIGCGQGALLVEIQAKFPHIRPCGVDLSSRAIELARARVPGGEFFVLDVVNESLARKFDLVICSEVLEHIPDDVAAMCHLAAMTGKYLVVTTLQGRMRPSEVVMGHVRNYARGELAYKLAQSGLRVTRTIEWGFPFYSPLYRDFLDRIGNRGTSGKYGVARKIIAAGLYALFALNSTRSGDEILLLAEPANMPSVG